MSKFVFFAAEDAAVTVNVDDQFVGSCEDVATLVECLFMFNITPEDRIACSSSIDFASEEGFENDGAAMEMIEAAFDLAYN